MLLFPELFLKIESELIFTIVILQFKTGVKSTLTSQIKELDAINTFGIKKLINLDKIQNENETNDGLLAMRMNLGLRLRSWARCNDGNEMNLFSQELDKWEKPF